MIKTKKYNKNNKRDIITDIEYNLSKLASIATSNAFKSALSRGESVLIAENKFLYECLPDGRRVFVEKIVSKKVYLNKYKNKKVFKLKINKS